MSDSGLCPECGEYIGDIPESTGHCPNCGADEADEAFEDDEA